VEEIMIVICEECGKRYRIDPDKMKSVQARFKCKTCGHLVIVQKPGAALEAEPPSPPPSPQTQSSAMEMPSPAAGSPGKQPARAMGLRAKMTLLFFLIPIALAAAAGFLYLWQLERLSTQLTTESSRVATRMAEDRIAEKARSVALEVRLFLTAGRDLQKQKFNETPEFRTVAVQKVGETGYTAVYEFPDSEGVWRTWAHANAKIIGIDMKTLEKSLGKNFPGFWKVFSGVQGGKESKGYYAWQDPDGSVRDKYMVCTPIEGTRFVVAATTYLDEFTMPVKVMEANARKSVIRARNATFGILAGTLILMGLIVSIYGHRLTSRIRNLTQVADRISVGELETEVVITTRDEIGDLGEAITRMQDSIRLSIERLRRRR
jgi:HAMP domain-containing protein